MLPTFASKLPLFEFRKIYNKQSYYAENPLISQSMLKRQLKAEMLALYAINVRLVNTDCKNYQLMIKTSCIVLVLIMTFIYFIYKFENDVQLFFCSSGYFNWYPILGHVSSPVPPSALTFRQSQL